MNCIFCIEIEAKSILLENNLAFVIYDTFPVNKGHILVIPKRHFASYFDATYDELLAFNDLIKKAKIMLDNQFQPDGYNIGINIGEKAGQTIFHLHIHVIPRYNGDVENPRGGIRRIKKPLVEYDG